MKVIAVVVSYHPSLAELRALVDSLHSQVAGVIVVDNTSPGIDLSSLEAIVITNGQNLGIAAAQNVGLDLAFSRSADAVILFDQDSRLQEGFVISLTRQLETLGVGGRPVVIGPSIYCLYEDRLHESLWQPAFASNTEFIERTQLIASGMMINRTAFEVVGPMLEPLFIDAVDHEWCWRAQKRGVTVYQSNTVTLEHKMGDARYKVFGVWTKLTAPSRLYYQFRNTLWLVPSGHVPLYWKCRNLFAIPVKLVLLICLHPDKKERLGHAFRGLKDGLLGYRGFRERAKQYLG